MTVGKKQLKGEFLKGRSLPLFERPPFSLQGLIERFRRLAGLLIATVCVADRGADILVGEELVDFPQVVFHMIKEDRGRAVAQPVGGDLPYPELCARRPHFFFYRVVGTTRIIQGDPGTFTCELARRWRTEYQNTAPEEDGFGQISEEMPRGAVFISYSRDDLEAVRRLVRGLRGAQVPVWLDKQRLRGGENYERSLEFAVKNGCSFFLSIVSRATETNPERFVHQERHWAAQRHVEGFVFYIPVIIDETAQPTREPEQFAKIHFERLPKGNITATFATRLRQLVEEYRLSGQPRA